MSNANNPNFVSELVMMAKAFEELPQVKAELHARTHDLDVAQKTIQSLQLRIIDLKNEADEARSRTRLVEVERDHAEHMFLEAEDRTEKALAFVRLVQGNAQSLIDAVSPPKPEPIPEPQVEDQRASHPIDASSLGSSPSASQSEPSGESAADPTLTSTQTTESTQSSGDGTQSDKGSISDVTEGVSVPRDPTLATESSSENVSSVSASPSQPEPGGFSMQPIHREAEEATAAAPVDPTASSTAGDGHSSETATPTTAPSSADATHQATSDDDVGYHNEPKIAGDGEARWEAWDAWSERMNKRFGTGHWPLRPSHGVA